jgi:hypothetical protein
LNIRKALLRVPVLGPWVERRWMPDPIERDLHREIVRGRLAAAAAPDPPAAPAETKQLTGGAPED